jgi:hypothetical protein
MHNHYRLWPYAYAFATVKRMFADTINSILRSKPRGIIMYRKKQLWMTALGSLIAATGLLHAEDAQMRNLENRVSALEQRKNANGMINPNARPLARDGAGIMIEGAALYWQAQENGLDFVIDNRNGTTIINDGKYKYPKPRWDWGFKLGLDFDMAHDGWNLCFLWTRFHTRAKKTVNQADGGLLFPIYSRADLSAPLTPGTTPTQAQSNLKIRLDILDAVLGREFFTSKWLILQPYLGIRTAWINQKMRINYYNLSLPSEDLGNIQDRLKNNYWGIGPRAGLNGQWGLGGGFSIFGDSGLSLLCGKFTLNNKEEATLASDGSVSGTPTQTKRKPRTIRAMADLTAGFRYETGFADDAYALRIDLGWEEHFFFGQNQFYRLMSSEFAQTTVFGEGDLSTQGVTLKVGFGF